jgi:hypothetical protein
MFVRLVLLLLIASRMEAQEIRRAIPVNPAPPTATPAQPVTVVPGPSLQPVPNNQAPPLANPAPVAVTQLAPATVNDTARFLAGMQVSETSSLVSLEQTATWQRHARFFDDAWAKLSARQFAGIRDWEVNYLPDATQPLPVVYYMFSGPDFLYANQFYPNANTYILAGTEPIGPLPEVTHFGGAGLDSVLQNLQKSLNSVLSFSFFITKDMKTDLQNEQLKGTLPIFYVFLARAGKTITDIRFITLDRDGQQHQTVPNEKGKGLTLGVHLIFSTPEGASQNLYYFTTDLSNDGIRSQPGFLKFCAATAPAASLLKSASYLMFQNGFSTIRDFLLSHSKAIVQDDSGIPVAAFDQSKWSLRFFGNYPGPIDLFKQYFQPNLQEIYRQSNPAPLGFGIGYRWSPQQSTLIVATPKGSEVSPLRTEPPTAAVAALPAVATPTPSVKASPASRLPRF